MAHGVHDARAAAAHGKAGCFSSCLGPRPNSAESTAPPTAIPRAEASKSRVGGPGASGQAVLEAQAADPDQHASAAPSKCSGASQLGRHLFSSPAGALAGSLPVPPAATGALQIALIRQGGRSRALLPTTRGGGRRTCRLVLCWMAVAPVLLAMLCRAALDDSSSHPPQP